MPAFCKPSARSRVVSVGEAMDALAAAKKLADLWLGRLVTGIAYETFGHRVEARDEFDKCAQRLGEASAIFLDDIPTFRYVAHPARMAAAGQGPGQARGVRVLVVATTGAARSPLGVSCYRPPNTRPTMTWTSVAVMSSAWMNRPFTPKRMPTLREK